MSDVADDVRARVEEATTVSSSDDTEVYHHGDLMAVVEERKDAWNVRVYRGNSEGQSIWEREYDGRTSAEAGAKSAMYQIEREDGGLVEEQYGSKKNKKDNSHEYGAVPEGENEPWERVEDLDELREGDQIRVATDADAANALGTSGVWTGHVAGNKPEESMVLAHDESSRIILEYPGLDGVGDVKRSDSGEVLGMWATVWKLRGMGKEHAATVGDTPHDDPFEQIRPGDVSEGDDLRLHLGPAAANHFGEEMIAGSVSRTSDTDATIDLWDRAPVKWDVSNRILTSDGITIGVVERVERVRGMGEEHARTQAAHGGPFERFEEIYGVFQPRYGEFARGGIFGKQFYETAEEAQELLEQAREDGAEDAFIARITPAD